MFSSNKLIIAISLIVLTSSGIFAWTPRNDSWYSTDQIVSFVAVGDSCIYDSIPSCVFLLSDGKQYIFSMGGTVGLKGNSGRAYLTELIAAKQNGNLVTVASDGTQQAGAYRVTRILFK